MHMKPRMLNRIASIKFLRLPINGMVCAILFAGIVLLFFAGMTTQGQAEDTPEVAVTVIADGEQLSLSTTSLTVLDVLQEAGVILGEMDRIQPDVEMPVHAGMRIHVTRVEAEIIDEEVVEPHKVTVLRNPDFRHGISATVREGVNGKLRRMVRVWKKDGVETRREVVKTVQLKKPVDAIEMRGSSSLSSRGGAIRRSLVMSASAYEPGPRSCGKSADGYTSIGMRATKGVVAVDPRVIPMRTKLYVEGYGFAIAADVGSAIKGNRIDLCYDTYAEAIRFGRKKVRVYILD